MDSESARMSSAAEARFRIDYPNSKPRVVKVVALDAASERVVKRVAQQGWQRATFFTSIKFEGQRAGAKAWWWRLGSAVSAGGTRPWSGEGAAAVPVVMVPAPG